MTERGIVKEMSPLEGLYSGPRGGGRVPKMIMFPHGIYPMLARDVVMELANQHGKTFEEEALHLVADFAREAGVSVSSLVRVLSPRPIAMYGAVPPAVPGAQMYRADNIDVVYTETPATRAIWKIARDTFDDELPGWLRDFQRGLALRPVNTGDAAIVVVEGPYETDVNPDAASKTDDLAKALRAIEFVEQKRDVLKTKSGGAVQAASEFTGGARALIDDYAQSTADAVYYLGVLVGSARAEQYFEGIAYETPDDGFSRLIHDWAQEDITDAVIEKLGALPETARTGKIAALAASVLATGNYPIFPPTISRGGEVVHRLVDGVLASYELGDVADFGIGDDDRLYYVAYLSTMLDDPEFVKLANYKLTEALMDRVGELARIYVDENNLDEDDYDLLIKVGQASLYETGDDADAFIEELDEGDQEFAEKIRDSMAGIISTDPIEQLSAAVRTVMKRRRSVKAQLFEMFLPLTDGAIENIAGAFIAGLHAFIVDKDGGEVSEEERDVIEKLAVAPPGKDDEAGEYTYSMQMLLRSFIDGSLFSRWSPRSVLMDEIPDLDDLVYDGFVAWGLLVNLRNTIRRLRTQIAALEPTVKRPVSTMTIVVDGTNDNTTPDSARMLTVDISRIAVLRDISEADFSVQWRFLPALDATRTDREATPFYPIAEKTTSLLIPADPGVEGVYWCVVRDNETGTEYASGRVRVRVLQWCVRAKKYFSESANHPAAARWSVALPEYWTNGSGPVEFRDYIDARMRRIDGENKAAAIRDAMAGSDIMSANGHVRAAIDQLSRDIEKADEDVEKLRAAENRGLVAWRDAARRMVTTDLVGFHSASETLPYCASADADVYLSFGPAAGGGDCLVEVADAVRAWKDGMSRFAAPYGNGAEGRWTYIVRVLQAEAALTGSLPAGFGTRIPSVFFGDTKTASGLRGAAREFFDEDATRAADLYESAPDFRMLVHAAYPDIASQTTPADYADYLRTAAMITNSARPYWPLQEAPLAESVMGVAPVQVQHTEEVFQDAFDDATEMVELAARAPLVVPPREPVIPEKHIHVIDISDEEDEDDDDDEDRLDTRDSDDFDTAGTEFSDSGRVEDEEPVSPVDEVEQDMRAAVDAFIEENASTAKFRTLTKRGTSLASILAGVERLATKVDAFYADFRPYEAKLAAAGASVDDAVQIFADVNEEFTKHIANFRDAVNSVVRARPEAATGLSFEDAAALFRQDYKDFLANQPEFTAESDKFAEANFYSYGVAIDEAWKKIAEASGVDADTLGSAAVIQPDADFLATAGPFAAEAADVLRRGQKVMQELKTKTDNSNDALLFAGIGDTEIKALKAYLVEAPDHKIRIDLREAQNNLIEAARGTGKTLPDTVFASFTKMLDDRVNAAFKAVKDYDDAVLTSQQRAKREAEDAAARAEEEERIAREEAEAAHRAAEAAAEEEARKQEAEKRAEEERIAKARAEVSAAREEMSASSDRAARELEAVEFRDEEARRAIAARGDAVEAAAAAEDEAADAASEFSGAVRALAEAEESARPTPPRDTAPETGSSSSRGTRSSRRQRSARGGGGASDVDLPPDIADDPSVQGAISRLDLTVPDEFTTGSKIEIQLAAGSARNLIDYLNEEADRIDAVNRTINRSWDMSLAETLRSKYNRRRKLIAAKVSEVENALLDVDTSTPGLAQFDDGFVKAATRVDVAYQNIASALESRVSFGV